MGIQGKKKKKKKKKKKEEEEEEEEEGTNKQTYKNWTSRKERGKRIHQKRRQVTNVAYRDSDNNLI